ARRADRHPRLRKSPCPKPSPFPRRNFPRESSLRTARNRSDDPPPAPRAVCPHVSSETLSALPRILERPPSPVENHNAIVLHHVFERRRRVPLSVQAFCAPCLMARSCAENSVSLCIL